MFANFSNCDFANIRNKDVRALAEAGTKLVEMYSQLVDKTASFSQAEYDEKNKKFCESLVKACMKNTPYEFSSVKDVADPQVYKASGFKDTFASVLSQIINPVAPAVTSSQFSDLADVHNVGYGENGIFQINSNELFVVNDIAEGVLHGGLQRLYNNEVSVSAKPKQIRFDMPWYQLAAGRLDFGQAAYRVGISFAAYINAMIIKTLMEYVKAMEGNSIYVEATGFSDANWLAMAQRVSAVNGGAQVLAIGDLATIGTILPNTVGLQYGLGPDYVRKGHLDMYKGVRIEVIDPTIVPGTENTTALLAVPSGVIFMLPVGMNRPVKIVFEGANTTVEALPTETADKVAGYAVTMRVGMAMVVGSRFGVISGVK